MSNSTPNPETRSRRFPMLFAIGVVIALVVGGIVGLSGYTFVYAQGFSYLSDDPAACANCHVMKQVYDAYPKSSHHYVAKCNDCHTPHQPILKYAVKALNGFNHSLHFTLGDYPDPIRITDLNKAVAYANCLECHTQMVSSISHANEANPTDCFRCHQGMGHPKD